jgi:alkylation response protein AidB-like acyl-CoA dehydrogenase
MDFSLSFSQTALQDSVKRFCREHYSLKSRASLLRSSDGYSRDHWKTFASLGWLGVTLPSDVHGLDATAIESAIILGEFGRALVVEPYWSCALMAGHLINSGNARQRSELLVPLVAGELMVAVAHSEALSGSYVEHVETRAEDRGGGAYLLNGRKTMVVGGQGADKLIVSARTSGETKDRNGISLFVLDCAAEGVSRRAYQFLDGTKACDVDLADVRAEGALIGRRDAGGAALNWAIDQAIVGLCAEAVGIIDSALWMTRDYLRTRRQYGVTLSTLQALQHRMADMFVEVELSRSMLFRALGSLGHPDETVRRTSVLAAHIHVCKSGMFVCKNAVQLHGAMGMTEEHMIGQYFKRLVVISGLFGGMDQELECVATALNSEAFGTFAPPHGGVAGGQGTKSCEMASEAI